MEDSNSNKKELNNFLKAFVPTLVFWLIAHGYRFMNNLHTSDSLVSVFQDDILWQRSLGRFMQPLTMMVRGTITAPWLIFCITLAFFSAAVYLVCKLLKIDNTAVTVLIAGVLVCNVTMTSSVAAFLPWVDIYAVSFFLAALGVWFYSKDNVKGYIFGSICFVMCMGFYQAYIDVALALLFIVSIVELADKDSDIKKCALGLVKRFGSLLVSGGAYFVLFKIVCKIHHVEAASTYNGLSGVGDYSGTSIGGLFIGAYGKFFETLFNPTRFVSTYFLGRKVSDAWTLVLQICVIAVFLIIIAGLVYLNIKNKTKTASIILQAVGLATFPFAVNFVYFLSKGMEHELMIFSFFFVGVFAIVIMNLILQNAGKKKYIWLLAIPFVLLVWNNIVYSNQIYFKIDMEDRAALATATRLVADIEDVDEYNPGVTPVVFIGGLETSSPQVVYLRELEIYGNGTTPFTYDSLSLKNYLSWYMNVPMNIADIVPEEGISDELAVYPAKDSMLMRDGILYVKLSQ